MEKINADKCSMIKMILIKVTTRTKPFLKLCLTIKLQEDGTACPVIGSISIFSLAGHYRVTEI
jgi:hypothetical protein